MSPNVVAVLLACLAAGAGGPKDAPLNTHYLRTHAETRGFMLGRPVKARPTPDGKAVLFLRSEARLARLRLYEFDVATGQTRELAAPERLLPGAEALTPEEKARRERMRVSVGGFTDFQLSADGSRVLTSLAGKLYLVERPAGAIHELKTGPGTLLDPKLSPDGKQVAYVRDHDVYVLDLATRQERRLTTGGTERVTHGLAEFVAQEEMYRYSGYWWSPDGRSIAYEEADSREVETWYVADPAHPEKPAHASFYPRPGKPNARVRLGITPVAGGDTTWVSWDAQRYPYLTRVRWEKGAPLTLEVQTRDQKELVLLRANADGKTTPLLTERDAVWINLDKEMPRWLPDGSGFLWTSERAGGPQLELRNADGSLRHVLVPPEAGYHGFVDVDPKGGTVVFRASTDPTQSHLYRVPLAGGPATALTTDPGQHTATFGDDHSVYVHEESPARAMPRSVVRRADGTPIGVLPSVALDPPFEPTTAIQRVGPEPGFYTAVTRPRGFDPGRRYPVIVDVYGGPHRQVVVDVMRVRLLDQWLADQGFVVVSVDNRGTPGRGRAWERAIYQRFGSVPLDDQVAGLQALGRQFPELDLERVGIVGWSFGGYLSGLAVLRRPEVYRAAVAGAPVVDWLDYDTHYTERYLGIPPADEAAYTEASLLTYAAGLRRPLLIVHGTADDNVYFRHSLKLADALFRAGKEFELLPLSGLTHMVPEPEVMERLWSRIAVQFKKHLGEPHAK